MHIPVSCAIVASLVLTPPPPRARASANLGDLHHEYFCNSKTTKNLLYIIKETKKIDPLDTHKTDRPVNKKEHHYHHHHPRKPNNTTTIVHPHTANNKKAVKADRSLT